MRQREEISLGSGKLVLWTQLNQEDKQKINGG